jgi:hypothetical protein
MYNRLYALMMKEVETIIASESSRLRKKRRDEEKKKLKEQIQSIEDKITMWDKYILHTYYCSDIVKNMPDKYSHLRDIVINICYPEFLRKEHKRNPELIKYVNSLPAPPAAIITKTIN